jgi:RNA 2',3'-cyclic 3'-phosphodiesterase
MKRLFAAIKIHPSVTFISLLYQFKQALRNENIKWVEPQNIHITLKFFGETEDFKIKGIIDQLTDVASRHEPFDFSIKGTGIFGSSYNPRVIWFGISERDELINLSNDVLNSMAKIGWERDRQNFVPHLTAGRIKHISDKVKLNEVIEKYKNIEIQEVKTNAFYLYESILRTQGPIYNILETFNFESTPKSHSSSPRT